MMWSMDPWRELDQMRRQLESVIDPLTRPLARRVFPSLNLYDSGEEIVLAAQLSGLTKDDIQVTFTDGVLTLSGTRRPPGLREVMTPLRQERPVGRFEKSIELPVKIDPERISASFRNGIMTVRLPKAAEARPRPIAVSVE